MGTIVIEPAAAYLRGHFPGRPILPGVVQLQLLVEHLSQETGQTLALRSIKFARLRQLVVPGDRLEILTRPGEGAYTRVDVKRDGVLVANAELELGSAATRIESPYAVPSVAWRSMRRRSICCYRIVRRCDSWNRSNANGATGCNARRAYRPSVASCREDVRRR